MNNKHRTGAQILLDFLLSKNVKTIFAITGAGNLALLDEISRSKKIELVFGHHEQSLIMAAQGYSRVTGLPGIVIVTTGGGTSNSLTGVLSAQLDSVPVFLISGNESSFHCDTMKDFRAFGVQGFDSVKVLQPVTKSSSRIQSLKDLNVYLENAWREMISNREGPVHIDFPMDLQRTQYIVGSKLEIQVTEFESTYFDSKNALEVVKSLLANSNKPLFYLGNGLRKNGLYQKILKYLEDSNIPFILSWSAIDFVPTNHPLLIGKVGIYGDRAANILLQQCDLLVCLGTRLAIPQVGYNKNDFARKATKVVVEIDNTELSKFDGLNWYLFNTDASLFYREVLTKISHKFDNDSSWDRRISMVRNILSVEFSRLLEPEIESRTIHSIDAVKAISQLAPSNSIVVTDVGAALLSGHQFFGIKQGQRFFTSQGLGEMGFGLPASIGAFFADKSRPLICLNTDGAIMFNLQDLQMVNHFKIPLKLVIFNNMGYSMIKISQSNLFDGNFVGSTIESGISFPNFMKVATAFEFDYHCVETLEDLFSLLPQIFNNESPCVIDIKMDPNQKYYPRLSTSKMPSGELVSPPLEDLDPKISLKLLEEVLGYTPTVESKSSRLL